MRLQSGTILLTPMSERTSYLDGNGDDTGVVVSVAEDLKVDKSLQLKEGDVVRYIRNKGVTFRYLDELHVLINKRDILIVE